jgi:hypothetical protein
VRRECLDHLLIGGRRQLLGILGIYTRHDNRHRPHRSLDLSAPERSERYREAEPLVAEQLRRRNVLGGLIHEYDHAAGQLADFWHPTGAGRQRPPPSGVVNGTTAVIQDLDLPGRAA